MADVSGSPGARVTYSARRRAGTPWQRGHVMKPYVCLLLAALLAGCAGQQEPVKSPAKDPWASVEKPPPKWKDLPPKPQPPAKVEPEKKPLALLKEEETVKAFILDHVGDPKSVEFVKWGPHVLSKALRLKRGETIGMGPQDQTLAILSKNVPFLWNVPTDDLLPVVRVRFRANNSTGGRELHDALFTLSGGAGVPCCYKHSR